jgi:predicted dehydrogenase
MVGAALAAGAHVYCEKPFTRTLAEADDLLARAAGAGLRIAVAHQGRLAPTTLELKRQLDAGLIGELLEIRAWGKQDRRAGGEDLVVLGTHQFDLVRYFAGDPLWCTARILQNGQEVTRADVRAATEDIGPVVGTEIDASFALPAGVMLHFSSRAKNAAATGPWGMEMIGTKGRVKLLNDVYPLTFVLEREARPGADETLAWRPLPGDLSGKESAAARGTGPANRRVVDDWLAAIAAKREALCSGFAAMKSLEMIHAVFAAGIARGRVQLPLENRSHPLA